jgi:hypothetical protein
MKKALLACSALLALAFPAYAGASIVSLDPSAPGTPLTTAEAIVDDPSMIVDASLPQRAFGGAGAPSPIGYGDKTLDPEPKVLTDFPTFGDRYGILSSGEINTIASLLTNTSPSTTFQFTDQFNEPGSPVRGADALDYTVLQIDVNVPAGANCLALDYRFMSEEFPEFVGSQYNDAFIAELDESLWSVDEDGNITRPNDFAVAPDGNPISINGVGDTAVFPEEAAGTYFDAATGLITTKKVITPGPHTIYLTVFDASDKRYDSAVFLDHLRFITESSDTCKPPEGKQIELPPPPPTTNTTPTPTPAPPSNAFTFGPSVRFRSGGTSATLEINAPGPGTLTAASVAVGKASAALARAEAAAKGKAKAKKCKPKKGKKCKKAPKPKALLVPGTARANGAGPVQVTVKLSGTGKAILAKKGKLTVPVTITFTPDGGTAASQVKTITFKKPATKKCKGKGKKACGKAKGKAKKK